MNTTAQSLAHFAVSWVIYTLTPLWDQTKAGVLLEIVTLVSYSPVFFPLPWGHFCNKSPARRSSFQGLLLETSIGYSKTNLAFLI